MRISKYLALSLLTFGVYAHAAADKEFVRTDASVLNEEINSAKPFGENQLEEYFSKHQNWVMDCLLSGKTEKNSLDPLLPSGTQVSDGTWLRGLMKFQPEHKGRYGFGIHFWASLSAEGQDLEAFKINDSYIECNKGNVGDCKTLSNPVETVSIATQSMLNSELIAEKKYYPTADYTPASYSISMINPDKLVARVSASVTAKYFNGFWWNSKEVTADKTYSPSLMCELTPAK